MSHLKIGPVFLLQLQHFTVVSLKPCFHFYVSDTNIEKHDIKKLNSAFCKVVDNVEGESLKEELKGNISGYFKLLCG